MKLREMDERTTYLEQLQEDDGQVVLINQFEVPPEGADRFLEVWADDAAFMTRQPGFVSTQLHRGTAGSSTFVNVAVWASAAALGSGLPFARVPCPGRPLPGRSGRRAPRLQEGRRPGDLHGLTSGSDTEKTGQGSTESCPTPRRCGPREEAAPPRSSSRQPHAPDASPSPFRRLLGPRVIRGRTEHASGLALSSRGCQSRQMAWLGPADK
jgi:hypothetical protein